MSVTVLRLNHRPQRDKRITTHLFLTARSFGAQHGIYTGKMDPSVEESVKNVVQNWGGSFDLVYSDSWRNVISEMSDIVIHLTMYGLPIQNVVDDIRGLTEPKLIVVGGPKVPGEIYRKADWNIAITNQPHSEVSALAVFLHELFQGSELSKRYTDARLKIIPKAHGKLVERRVEEFKI